MDKEKVMDPFEQAAARDREERAQRRTQLVRRSWNIHLAVYVSVQVLLIATWALTTPGGYPWFVFVVLGWGIGLGAHYAAARPHSGKTS